MLDALGRTHKHNPRRLAEETRRLMEREKVSPLPVAGCVGGLIQLPVFIALYGAVRDVAVIGVRFLWVRDLSRPDIALAAAATLFTVAATASGPSAPMPNRAIILIMSGVVTAVALSKLAAGVGLYCGLSSLFGAVQGVVHRRTAPAA